MNEQTLAHKTGNLQRDIFLSISAHLARETEIQAALASIASEIGTILPFTHFDICLIDSPEWLVSYEVGIATRWSRRRTRLHNSPVRDIFYGKLDYMLCTNAMEDPRQTFKGASSAPIFNHGLRARVLVGMKVMGQLVGTLNISHNKANTYNATSLNMAQHLADLLAPYFHALRSIEKAQRDALERAEVQSREEGLRLGASQLTQALEQERQCIGMDLHDQTLADLTRVLRLIQNDSEEIDRDFMADTLSTSITDLRRIIEKAVPSQLELFGFNHAVSEHLEKASHACNISTSVTDQTSGVIDRMSSAVRTAAFRITQEATNNAVQHADATCISITVDYDPVDALRITVRDNGCGISAGNNQRRSGLLHMETRARLALAHLEITEASGTCVTLTLPKNDDGDTQ